MNTKNKGVVDFILNESFQRWVINPQPEDTLYWETWIGEHPEAVEAFEESKKIISFIMTRKVMPRHTSISDEVFEKLRLQIENETNGTVQVAQRRSLRWVAFAACAVVLLGLGLFYNYNRQLSQNLFSQNLEVIVPKGQRSQLVLPDGTRVWLNAGTVFKYPSSFLRQGREVYLEGEAFFDVTHNRQPFIVHLKDRLFVKVFGTQFNVKCYADDKIVETTLIKGKVNFVRKDANDQIIDEIKLAPKEKVVYEKQLQRMTVTKLYENLAAIGIKNPVPQTVKNTKEVQIREADANSEIEIATAWKENTLAFEDETLGDISIKMERWFGIPIKIADEDLKKERFTGNFNNQESVYQILDILNRSEPIQYTRQDKMIIISKRKHN